jgi:cell division protein ZapA (FtsZ GTPase activity inhibitor)
MAPSVTRALRAIKRYGAQPEQIDYAILAAINATLCLASGGDDRVAEGFNSDIMASGRGFGRHLSGRAEFPIGTGH